MKPAYEVHFTVRCDWRGCDRVAEYYAMSGTACIRLGQFCSAHIDDEITQVNRTAELIESLSSHDKGDSENG